MKLATLLGKLYRGPERWNAWRRDNPGEKIDLTGVDLSGARLMNVDLRRAELWRANLADVNLRGAQLDEALLGQVSFDRAKLSGATFGHASLGDNSFLGTDLSACSGLETTRHSHPSRLDIATLRMGRGRIPAEFLRGCGLSETEIAFARLYDPELPADSVTSLLYEIDLRRNGEPVQISPVFVSYAHADSPFVEYLENALHQHGVRFWRDVHNLVSGRMDLQIDRAIRLNPTVLLVLSQNSIGSDWVQWEVSRARETERALGRDVICPVALDDSWKRCDWPGPLLQHVQKYNIVDLTGWLDPVIREQKLEKVITGLRLFYQAR